MARRRRQEGSARQRQLHKPAPRRAAPAACAHVTCTCFAKETHSLLHFTMRAAAVRSGEWRERRARRQARWALPSHRDGAHACTHRTGHACDASARTVRGGGHTERRTALVAALGQLLARGGMRGKMIRVVACGGGAQPGHPRSPPRSRHARGKRRPVQVVSVQRAPHHRSERPAGHRGVTAQRRLQRHCMILTAGPDG
jgi:hypothetical protein